MKVIIDFSKKSLLGYKSKSSGKKYFVEKKTVFVLDTNTGISTMVEGKQMRWPKDLQKMSRKEIEECSPG